MLHGRESPQEFDKIPFFSFGFLGNLMTVNYYVSFYKKTKMTRSLFKLFFCKIFSLYPTVTGKNLYFTWITLFIMILKKTNFLADHK